MRQGQEQDRPASMCGSALPPLSFAMGKSHADPAIEARAITTKYQGLADVWSDFGRATYPAMALWWRQCADQLDQPPEAKLTSPSRQTPVNPSA